MEDNGLIYTESQYEKTDMSTRTQDAAARLLARNMDTQAIFCVNDATASGLYDVLRRKGLVPGKDVAVFGFDNGPLAADLIPPLSSIGADGMTLGQKALELLLDRMDDQDVHSQNVPTRLYGRESLEYETFEFTAREIMNADSAFIDHFFDNCFYRYRNEIINSEMINLKRLFFEILSRMLKGMKNRYISDEEFSEICKLIDVLFENGIMLYTDPNRFVRYISRLQTIMNETANAGFVSIINNRLFSLMKDKAIQFHGIRKRIVSGGYSAGRNRILDFLLWTTNYGNPGNAALEQMIGHISKIGLVNAAMYLYHEPIPYNEGDKKPLPATIRLRCVLRNRELFLIPEDRQECPVAEIYSRSELPVEKQGYISYPLFCGKYLFGILVCGIDGIIFEIGEFLTLQLGRAIFMNWVCPD